MKKISFDTPQIEFLQRNILKIFKKVQPTCEIHVSRHEPDNRVLEAAIESQSDFIITGDKDLLILKIYKGIRIITSNEFLEVFKS